MASRIVDRDCDTRKVDKGLKNPWKWEWLERKVGDQLIGRFIRKLSSRGLAFWELFSKEVNYVSRGWKAFRQHLLKKLHIENNKIKEVCSIRISRTLHTSLNTFSHIVQTLMAWD